MRSEEVLEVVVTSMEGSKAEAEVLEPEVNPTSSIPYQGMKKKTRNVSV